MDQLGVSRCRLHLLGVRDRICRRFADLNKRLKHMKGSVLALLLLADLGASTAYLCERDGEVMAYQMIGNDSACEIQLYPPNHPPEILWRGAGCLDLMLDILGFSGDEGWSCDLPTRSR